MFPEIPKITGYQMYDKINRTELQELCREIGEQNVYREDRRDSLIAEIEGDGAARKCPLDPQRKEMQAHIQKNFRRLRTQLPGCTGKCTTYGCPNLVVVRCWVGLKDHIL